MRTNHIGVFGSSYGHKIGEVVWSDDHATGMDAGVAHRTFDFHGFLQHLSLEVGTLINSAQFFGIGNSLLVAQFVDEVGLRDGKELAQR